MQHLPHSLSTRWLSSLMHAYAQINRLLAYIEPVAVLLLKIWIATVFFKSGLTKIQSLDTTIMLFTYEYSVPLLPPAIAAYLAIVAELLLPVLLVVGLAGRLSAFALFVFNFVAVISYPDISDAGIRDHIVWGIVLLLLSGYGAGKLSLDHLIKRKWPQQPTD